MNRNMILWLLVGALIIAGLGTGVFIMARGIRNNNPGNIRHGGSQWQGMSAAQTDSDYVQFDDPVFGIRALAKLLSNYQTRYGLNTVRAIITRWAPPIENITAAYIDNVSRMTGLGPDQSFNVTDYMVPMVKAIIKHENGEQPYTDEQINRGISLA
jgi:hypothetical protein